MVVNLRTRCLGACLIVFMGFGMGGCNTTIPTRDDPTSLLAKYVELIDASHPTVSGTILGKNGEQIGILVDRNDQGEPIQVTGIHYEDANNTAFTVLLGIDGLPEKLVIEGWVVEFHDYSTDAVIADVISPEDNKQTLSAAITDSRYLDVLRTLAQSGVAGPNAKSSRVEKADSRKAKLNAQDQTKTAGLILGSISCGIGVAQMLAPTGVSQISGALTILGCGATTISAMGAELGLAGTTLDIVSCGDDIIEFSPVLAVVDCTNMVLGIVERVTEDEETITRLSPQIVLVPRFDPSSRSFTDHIDVSISSATPGASIRYTIDGSTPTSSTGILYTGPIPLAASITLTAIAYKDRMRDSEISNATYAFNSTPPTQVLKVMDTDTSVFIRYQSSVSPAATVVNSDVSAARISNIGNVPVSNLHVASMISVNSNKSLLGNVIDNSDDGQLNDSLLPEVQLQISSNGYDASAPFTSWSAVCAKDLKPQTVDTNALAYLRIQIPRYIWAVAENNPYIVTIEGEIPDPVTPDKKVIVSTTLVFKYLVSTYVIQ